MVGGRPRPCHADLRPPVVDSLPGRLVMSMSLGQAWIQKAISKRTPQGEALRALEQAYAPGAEGTLIVGWRLTTSGRCYLARWDGWELTVLELDQAQQKEWNVNPMSLYQELRPISLPLKR